MKRFIVTSVVGQDRPGFVNQVTHVIHELGGNVELQRSTRMADEYAAIILFSLEGDAAVADAAIDALRTLQSDDLLVNARVAVSASGTRTPGVVAADLIASGADQPGIIDEVSLLLFKQNINIESMNYDVDSAPMTGEYLFRMEARVLLPDDTDVVALKTNLRDLEDRLNFDILFRYPA